MQEYIKKILEEAIWAPSGENIQPWYFKLGENRLFIYNDPEKDKSLYNYSQRSCLVSHGCLIENIFIASQALGYNTQIEIFPDENNKNLIAIVEFDKKTNLAEVSQYADLYKYIKERCTNRKPYKLERLNDAARTEIEQSAADTDRITVKLIDDPKIIRELAEVGASNEQLVFENRDLHKYLFDHITWSEREEIKSPGFYIKTLEIPPPVLVLFRAIKSWWVVRLLNRIGFSKLIKKGNAQVYRAAGAIGVLAISDRSNESYLQAGRKFQRLWLTAAKCGVSLQPLSGILFFAQAIEDKAETSFNERQKKMINILHNQVQNIFQLRDKSALVMFRLGYAQRPTARAMRKPLESFIATS